MSQVNRASQRESVLQAVVGGARKLQDWIEARDYAGYEPYDVFNSPLLRPRWLRRPPLGFIVMQISRRWMGTRLRRRLQIPASKNPKGLGLMLSGYCDLLRAGEDCLAQVEYLKAELKRLRSPGEDFYCWGYDWDFVSLRGSILYALRPHAIATVFCGQALLDLAEVARDQEAREMAISAAEFITKRLNHSVDNEKELCFSYTPNDKTKIYNSSLLSAALLARVANVTGTSSYLELARRAMNFAAKVQRTDGSWSYGAKRRQRWIDNFHTAYILESLLMYKRFSEDESFEAVTRRGYEFYKDNFFDVAIPKYFHNSRYPIDIHCCAQAVITFCAFRKHDPQALSLACQVAGWTLRYMQDPQGYFYFQRHRTWVNRTPYMRWGQSWMFRALTCLRLLLIEEEERVPLAQQQGRLCTTVI